MHVFICIYDLLLHILSIWKHALSSSLIIMVKTSSFLPQASLSLISIPFLRMFKFFYHLAFTHQLEDQRTHKWMYVSLCVCVPRRVWLHGLKSARCFCPWNFPNKETSELPFLPLGIFLTQGSNPLLLHLLHWQVDSLPPGKAQYMNVAQQNFLIQSKNQMLFSRVKFLYHQVGMW